MLRPLPFSEGPFCSKESHYISPLTKKKIPLRVFATAEHAHQTQLLLDTTAKILPVYEKVTLNLFQYYSLDNSPNMNSFPFYSRYSIFLILFLKLSRSGTFTQRRLLNFGRRNFSLTLWSPLTSTLGQWKMYVVSFSMTPRSVILTPV